jgi:hypothetical protein
VPGGTIQTVVATEAGRVRVEIRRPDAPGVTRLILERDTGTGLTVQEPGREGAWDIVRRLHSGDFAGWLSRVLYALAGVALPALSITGYLVATRPRASP